MARSWRASTPKGVFASRIEQYRDTVLPKQQTKLPRHFGEPLWLRILRHRREIVRQNVHRLLERRGFGRGHIEELVLHGEVVILQDLRPKAFDKFCPLVRFLAIRR